MLELQHIHYAVQEPEGKLEILKDISLTIDDHRLVVFTGPNGGGKTTLAKIVMGLVKPTSGKILWNGEDVTDLGITERAKRGISYGFQQPPPVQGSDRPGPSDHCGGRRAAFQGALLPVSHTGGPVRQRLSGPGGGRVPLRRRGEAH